MGIQGLLQALKPLIQPTNIAFFQGKRVAVDGYCWLHKAVYGCAIELCLQQHSDSWIKYCLSFLEMLLHHKITVVLVFDGAELPAKRKTEEERSENRKKNLELGREYYKNNDLKTARNYFARAVDITPQMAAEFIAVVNSLYPESVQCIVAPYEADAQLAYLSRNDLVDAVISEDSDCIIYGCQEIIFKLNRDGSCERLICADICSKLIDIKFDLRGFNAEMLLSMCIFAGCDYLESLPGIGLKTSYKLMCKHRDGVNVLKALRLDGLIPMIPALTEGSSVVLLDYELKYFEAWSTFHHQIVYDPRSKQMVNLSAVSRETLPQCIREAYSASLSSTNSNPMSLSLPFWGIASCSEIAQSIAEGRRDPVSKELFILKNRSIDVKQNHFGFNSDIKAARLLKPLVKSSVKPNQKVLGQNVMKRSASDSIVITEKIRRTYDSHPLQNSSNLYRSISNTANFSSARALSAPVPSQGAKHIDLTCSDDFTSNGVSNFPRLNASFDKENSQQEDLIRSYTLNLREGIPVDEKLAPFSSPFTTASNKEKAQDLAEPEKANADEISSDQFLSGTHKNFDFYAHNENYAEQHLSVGPFTKSLSFGSSTQNLELCEEEGLSSFSESLDKYFALKPEVRNSKTVHRKNTIKHYFLSSKREKPALSVSRFSQHAADRARSLLNTEQRSEDMLVQGSKSTYEDSLSPPSSSKGSIFERFALK